MLCAVLLGMIACAVCQEIALAETEDQLQNEIAKRKEMEAAYEDLAQQVLRERAELNALSKEAGNIQDVANCRLGKLAGWVRGEITEAEKQRQGNTLRVLIVEKFCEALSFTKYGERGVWFGEKKGLEPVE